MKRDPEDYDDELENMSEADFEGVLADAIQEWADENHAPPTSLATFEENGVLTRNRGLVVTIGQATFQVTIVRSR
jgi:hypothetical protein